ncbi:hypothetical protein QTN25_002986 [Entamoeba marina]
MISWIVYFLVCINTVFADDTNGYNEFELLSSYEFISNSDFFYDSDNEIDAFFSEFEDNANLDYMLNDLKALDNIKKKVKSEVDKGTKWMAEHGDKVSGVLDRVSNVAKRTSLVAGVVGKVATVASVVPGLNVVAAPIAAASFTVANAADKVKDVARLGRDVTMVATSLSKGYQDGGVKGAMKEGTKMVGNRLVNRAITKASEEITGAISNKAAGVLGKGITKLATKNVKLSGMVGKVSNVLKESELAEKVKEKVKKKLKGKVSKTLKKGVNKVAKGKKAVKAIKNKIPFIAKNIKSVAAKIKGSKSGTITAKKLQELKFNKGKVKSIASKFKRNGSGKTKIQQKSKPLGKIGKLKQKINTKTKLLSHKTTKKINSIKTIN